jgi:hypothetical protein
LKLKKKVMLESNSVSNSSQGCGSVKEEFDDDDLLLCGDERAFDLKYKASVEVKKTSGTSLFKDKAPNLEELNLQLAKAALLLKNRSKRSSSSESMGRSSQEEQSGSSKSLLLDQLFTRV